MGGFWLKDRLQSWGDQEAMVWRGHSFSYRWLCAQMDTWQARLAESGLAPGQVVALEADYSPQACALLLALCAHRNIVVPLTSATLTQRARFLDIAQVDVRMLFDAQDQWRLEWRTTQVGHPLLQQLRSEAVAGLVLFSSGSTGESKAVAHHVDRLLDKFRTPRHALRTLVFLLMDHIGGLNTLFYTFSNGGTVITLDERSPASVCRAIQDHRAEVLPTSPTFLNLLLLSEDHRRFDLSSLQLITYGTEPMPASTLQRMREAFPQVRFQQTYGLSELGILRSKSRDSSSLWVKVGGEGFETKVVDGVLWIRSTSAMLGYLNAPSPFDAEGWFNTQDRVEVDGEYIRILGRNTDIINVGGEKVDPAQVEGILLGMERVRDVTVRGEPNPIMGHVVAAQFTLTTPEALDALKRRVREYCRHKLPSYAVPVRVEITEGVKASSRFKKLRTVEAG